MSATKPLLKCCVSAESGAQMLRKMERPWGNTELRKHEDALVPSLKTAGAAYESTTGLGVDGFHHEGASI